jgi:hypothetical protein
MWRRVDIVWTDVTEERIASSFRVEMREISMNRFFYPENGGDMFLRNVGSHKIYTAPHPRRRHSSIKVWFVRREDRNWKENIGDETSLKAVTCLTEE